MATRAYPKKITPSTIGLKTADLEKVAAEKGKQKPVVVMRTYGRVSKMENGQTAFGSFIKFQGEFEAVNLLDESIHRSKTLILPACAETCLLEQIGAAKQDSKELLAVEFGLDITVEYYKNATLKGTEFRWGVRPLNEPSGEDSLSKLGQQFGSLPLLTAPGKKKR